MWAQVNKIDLRVDLVGSGEMGLPVKSKLVYCIDIKDRTDIKVGMFYNPDDGAFSEKIIESEQIAPIEIRNQEYQTTPLILWESKSITVDEANKVWVEYSAENNPKAGEIQTLIKSAKEYIRGLYPDK